MSSERLGLGDWFSPYTLPEFIRTVLGRRSLHVPAGPELALRLSEALGIASVEDVLRLQDPEVLAWFPRLDGHTVSAPVFPRSARTFYAGGTTLYVRNVAEFLGIEREFASVLGIPRILVNCELFCNRPNAVTSMHFDPSDVITIQLSGRKTWRIAPNRFAPTPLDGWAPDQPVNPKMRAYAPGPPPMSIPEEDAETYELEAGSLLHVPRGYWHETYSGEDSLSVHFVIPPPTRLDLVLGVLQNELARDEQWRRAAYRFDSPDNDSLDELTADYARLRELVLRLDPRDVVRMPVSDGSGTPHSQYQRCGQATIAVERVAGATAERDTERVSVIAYGFRDTRTTTLELSADFAAACRWIADLPTGAMFDVDELPGATATLGTAQAHALLATLEKAHLVRPHADPVASSESLDQAVDRGLIAQPV